MLDIDQYPHLQGLELADESLLYDTFSDVDILIGSDFYYDIITGDIRRGDEGPCAVNSEFGWLVCGSAKAKGSRLGEMVANFVVDRADSLSGDAFVSNEDQQLTDVLHKFWSIESIGIFEETDVGGKEFLSDVKYDETKSRYQVRLPWKERCLPESSGYPQCAKRLEHVYCRLKTEPVLLQEYDNVIRQQLRTGIIEEVSEPTKLEGTYYLPHHGVVRREKLTTKVRVVFDGSARHGSSSLSINECLEKGPNLVPHLFDVLVKFRGFPVGITSDVEKAFHQIEIDPDDRRMLRFLWVDDITKDKPDIVHYQFSRLVFGLTPSPAILSSVMEHHLKEQSEEHQSVASVLENSFYVDDFIGGAWNDSGAVEIYEKADEIMVDLNCVSGLRIPKYSESE